MALNPIPFTEVWPDASENQPAADGGWRHRSIVLAEFVAVWRRGEGEGEVGDGG